MKNIIVQIYIILDKSVDVAPYKRVNDCDFDVNVCPRRAGDLERSVLDNPSPFMQQLYTMEELLKIDKRN